MKRFVLLLIATFLVLDARCMTVATPGQLLRAWYLNFGIGRIKSVSCLPDSTVDEPDAGACALSSTVAVDIEVIEPLSRNAREVRPRWSGAGPSELLHLKTSLQSLYDAAYPQPLHAYSYQLLVRPESTSTRMVKRLFVGREVIFGIQVENSTAQGARRHAAGVWSMECRNWLLDNLTVAGERLGSERTCGIPTRQ